MGICGILKMDLQIFTTNYEKYINILLKPSLPYVIVL